VASLVGSSLGSEVTKKFYLILVLFDFAEIDKVGLLRNRFTVCRCVVAINAKVIYRFEVRVLKRFFLQRVGSV